jgi:hypothetical protein
MGDVTTLNRTLEQELFALLRGASLECLVCGEFVQHRAGGTIACPECGCVTYNGAPVHLDLSVTTKAAPITR